MDREKIVRRAGGSNYPIQVCKRCGTYAATDSRTKLEEHIDYSLNYCGVCRQLEQTAPPSDFGWPTFYTYANGAPVREV